MEEEFLVAAVEDARERNQRERVRLHSLRDESDPFSLAERKFKKLFRLPNEAARQLYMLLRDSHHLNESGYIPIPLKILAALHFYADGSYQAVVGQDNFLSLSQPSMCRALEETTNAIVDLLTPQHIKFPTTDQDKAQTKRDFQDLYNFPNVLGAVDCTHVAIFKPPNNHPSAPGVLFYNSKGYYSINCQVVTNARGKIISINPNFPGSTHDSAIWRASEVAKHLEREFLRGEQEQWLLGDKGYPLLPWLMTPLANPETEAERNYNRNHAQARNVVEIRFGRMKNKLRCLHKHRTLHYAPSKAAKIIVACCTIYNMFFDVIDYDDSDDEEDEDDIPDAADQNNADIEDLPPQANYLNMARAKRESLIQYFS